MVRAFDADIGRNSHVLYEIRDAFAAEHFTVDHGTGAVRSKAELDFETTPKFVFEVFAVDNGQPSLVSLVPTTLVIEVNEGLLFFRCLSISSTAVTYSGNIAR